MQGQFRFDQLVEWFPVVDRALLANGIHPTTGAVMEICNRIRFGLRDKSLIVDARRVVGDLGIAQEAVVFKQANPVLLALEDGREPLLRLVVDRFKRLFRSDADVDAAVERAGEELVMKLAKGSSRCGPRCYLPVSASTGSNTGRSLGWRRGVRMVRERGRTDRCTGQTLQRHCRGRVERRSEHAGARNSRRFGQPSTRAGCPTST